MNEGRESQQPEVLQIQLVSVYKSLPQREGAVGRMQQARMDSDPLLANKDAVLAAINHTNTAETPQIKIQQLERLMEVAEITSSSKDLILKCFQTDFAFGLGLGIDTYRTIGLLDDSRMEAGIFSKDPETRKEIERKIYLDRMTALEDFVKDYPDGSENESVEKQRKEIEELSAQFRELYREPILITPRD